MKTTGDRILDRPLEAVGGKGLFVKELDRALLEGRTELSVHSLKDLPMELPPELPILGFSRGRTPGTSCAACRKNPLGPVQAPGLLQQAADFTAAAAVSGGGGRPGPGQRPDPPAEAGPRVSMEPWFWRRRG